MLQDDRSLVGFPMRSLDFLFDLIFPAALVTLGSTQPITKMSARNLPGGKGRSTHKADNLATIREPIVRKYEILDVSQHFGSPRPVTWIALSFDVVILYRI
jgi:hypothetical protein